MALVGHISGSIQTNSAIGVTGSVVIADKPALTFPSLDSGIKFLVDEASLFKSTVVSSGSLTVKSSAGSPVFSVIASSGDTTVGGTLTSVGAATFQLGLSGSLTQLANGTSYLVAGSNITITSASNGQVTISTAGGGDITAVNAGTGLLGGGSSGDVTLSIDDSIVATVSGTTFRGTIQPDASGLRDLGTTGANWYRGYISQISGSHTQLIDGTSAFIAGTGMTITTGSNGAITLSSTASATPGGLNTQVQFNDGGSFGGHDGLTYTSATRTLSAHTLTVTGSGGLAVLQTATIGGIANLNGGIAVDTTAFTVADTTGNISTAGTLLVAQSITGSSTITIGGRANLNGGIAVDTTAFTVADVTGNVSTAGTLLVAQSITGSSTLTLSGQAILNGGIISDAGVFQVADTTGNITSAGTLSVAQSITGSSTLTISGQSLLNGGLQTQNATVLGTLGVVSSITGSSTLTMNGTAIFNADVDLGNAVTDTVTFTGRVDSDVLPIADSTYNLGSITNRWANVYTGDLHLRNDRGDYTLIEEEDMLTIRFNKTGKRYKFVLEAVPHLDEDPFLRF